MKQKYPDYSDIIDLPYQKSTRHTPMSIANRAAQFAPFAALTGHKEAIQETERMTDKKIILDEYQKEILNQKLQDILQTIRVHPQVILTYFKADDKKQGGSYVREVMTLKRFEEYDHTLIFSDKSKIPIEDIYQIDRYTESSYE